MQPRCLFSLYVAPTGGKQEPTGGLSLPGHGSEVGSKVSQSISRELLSASSVVTHHGSPAWRDTLPPSFACFLSLFLHFLYYSFLFHYHMNTNPYSCMCTYYMPCTMYICITTLCPHTCACAPATCTGL